MLTSMRYQNGTLSLIDQRKLPHSEQWLDLSKSQDIADAIVDMVVRGAPAIGCAAAFGIAVGFRQMDQNKTVLQSSVEVDQLFKMLSETRPTAVNLFYALDFMKEVVNAHSNLKVSEIIEILDSKADFLFQDDLKTCKSIGEHGANHLIEKFGVVGGVTHCNAGALATAGYGTAVSVFTELHRRGKLEHVFVDETRPWLQGARLTAYEMAHAGANYSLICDNAAAYFMKKNSPIINAVVVGADRIALNGDAANKIGTYSLALAAKHHGVGFYVAAPVSTFDFSLESGKEIPIEERDPVEVRSCMNGFQIANKDANVKNPSFDVTDASLISGIFTEHGVIEYPTKEKILKLKDLARK